MTTENDTPDRRNLLLGESANDVLEELADEYHDGNESAAVRDALHFSDKWREDGKSLPARLMQTTESLEEAVRELTMQVESLEANVENAEAAASDASIEEVDIDHLKREIRHAILGTNGRRIDSVAEELGAPVGKVRDAIHELEDNGKVRRTEDGEAPRFETYE